ncbi:MAG: di-trans,poly-cis-decaprenylcistransferase [Clostridia bacterium]|nr:di-trans,poly-cis-decaprenylcistransferase [Clostridia bacterium]
MENLKIPHHIGIIMDGNGRWAESRGKKRTYGHKHGSDNVDRIASYAFERGIKVVSLYAFSTENWQRPKEEVDELMRLLSVYFKRFLSKFVKNKIKVKIMGDVSALTPKLQKEIGDILEKTKDFDGGVLCLGINYGGRQEIVNAVNSLIKNDQPVTVENISNNLYTAELGEPDLIIRTGGEYRLSNFMLFQGAYSELYFTDVLWPDFDENELEKAIESFSGRTRRVGKVL